MSELLALQALPWDPAFRGILFVSIAVVILPGSVFMLLATNNGMRLGALLALTGLFGWLSLLTGVWTTYALAQGPRGEAPAWEVQEVLIDKQVSTVESMNSFPKGWHKLIAGEKILGDSSSVTDTFLVPPPPAPERKAPVPLVNFKSPFTQSSDYILLDAYRIGGQSYWPGGLLSREFQSDPNTGKNRFQKAARRWTQGFLHRPHYAVVRVQPVVVQPAPKAGQAPAKPEADPNAPIYSVVLKRNPHHPVMPFIPWRLTFMNGTRALPLLFFIYSFTLFSFFATWLHRRDKLAMALRVARTMSPATQ